MQARIQEVNLEDDPTSDIECAIILNPGKDDFYANWKVLESAGFILRNWEDKEIIVYSPRTKKVMKEALDK